MQLCMHACVHACMLALTHVMGSAGLWVCQELDTLLVKGNRLTALASLAACAQLQHLDASANQLAGMPSLDLPCQRLRHLSLNGNRCGTAQLSATMSLLQPITLLSISD